jgi:hypothetical protein
MVSPVTPASFAEKTMPVFFFSHPVHALINRGGTRAIRVVVGMDGWGLDWGDGTHDDAVDCHNFAEDD